MSSPSIQDQLSADYAALKAALRQWKCGSCGGSGEYFQRGKVADGEFFEGYVKCKVCNGKGLNPIASRALGDDD